MYVSGHVHAPADWPLRQNPRQQTKKRLGGPQSRSGCVTEGRSLYLWANTGPSSQQIPAELCSLCHSYYSYTNVPLYFHNLPLPLGCTDTCLGGRTIRHNTSVNTFRPIECHPQGYPQQTAEALTLLLNTLSTVLKILWREDFTKDHYSVMWNFWYIFSAHVSGYRGLPQNMSQDTADCHKTCLRMPRIATKPVSGYRGLPQSMSQDTADYHKACLRIPRTATKRTDRRFCLT
jgi:hypothetical protein